MLRDLAEEFVMGTRAFRYAMRGLMVLFMLGVTSPLLIVMEYVGNREVHSYCEALAPAVERAAAARAPAPEFKCPTIRLRP